MKTATTLKPLPSAQDVALDNLSEGPSELPNAIGVDKGVDHRVAMGEDYSQVHDPGRRTSTVFTEESEAVDDV